MFQHIDGKKSLSIQKNTVCDFCMFALVSKFLFVFISFTVFPVPRVTESRLSAGRGLFTFGLKYVFEFVVDTFLYDTILDILNCQQSPHTTQTTPLINEWPDEPWTTCTALMGHN